MRGISFGGMGILALGAAIGMASQARDFDGVEYDRLGFAHRGRQGRGTGWRDRKFEHPQGETTFRATGSKRSRRRRAARSS